MLFQIGGQTVGIVTRTPVLDGLGHPVVDEFMMPQTSEAVVWVRNCLFEVQESARPRTAEDERGGTVITNTTAWVFMPVTPAGLVPVFGTESGGVALTPVDPATIGSAGALRYGRDYEMRGDAVLEVDIKGRPDHVFALCEYQAG